MKTQNVFLMIIAALGVGMCLGAGLVNQAYERSLIHRGVAEYNAQTGEWQWKAEFRKGEK